MSDQRDDAPFLDSSFLDKTISRRNFVKGGLTALGAAGLDAVMQNLAFLQPVVDVENPLTHYPSRDWEKVYRDIYQVD
ncbi:MAG: twin-arginine translocation signal domain-containing protein [Thermaerobacterales bacterium]